MDGNFPDGSFPDSLLHISDIQEFSKNAVSLNSNDIYWN